MSEVHINDLPDQVLAKIFLFLDKGNLKNALLTCELWKILIESACRWTLSVYYKENQLWCTNGRENPMNFILTTNRKFGTIEIQDGRFSEGSRIIKMFQKHGFNVVELRLHHCRIENLDVFAELLSLTPNLKIVDVFSVELHSVSDVLRLDQTFPELKKLKNLTMYESDERIIECFRMAKLTKMKLIPPKSSQDFGKFLGFFELQTENLTELEMGWNFPTSLYERVFGMTKLNTLTVDVRYIPLDNDFYEQLKNNVSVHTLILRHICCDDVSFFRNFLKKLPNIRSLVMEDGCMEDDYGEEDAWMEMTQNLSKVESLSLGYPHRYEFNWLKFPNLRVLQIGCLHVKINWNEFTKIHCRLTEITVEEMENASHLTSDDIDQITTNVDLQVIRLGDGFLAGGRFFAIIRTKCKNLKVLDLNKSCISPKLKLDLKEINVLRLCDVIEYTKYSPM